MIQPDDAGPDRTGEDMTDQVVSGARASAEPVLEAVARDFLVGAAGGRLRRGLLDDDFEFVGCLLTGSDVRHRTLLERLVHLDIVFADWYLHPHAVRATADGGVHATVVMGGLPRGTGAEAVVRVGTLAFDFRGAQILRVTALPDEA